MIRFLQTPSQAKKIVLGGLLLLICGAMVITLIPGMGDSLGLGGASKGVVAKVGDQEIRLDEAEQSARQMIQQQYGGRIDASRLMPILLPQVVGELVQKKAMIVEAERLGLKVSDNELADALHHGSFGQVLFPNGQFIGTDAYEQLVQLNRKMSVQQFEQELKTELLLNKLRALIGGSVTVSNEEIRQEFVKRNTKVKFEYAVLATEDLQKQIHPAEAELKAYYDKNQKQFANTIPEKRQFQYVLIDSAKLKDRAAVTLTDLRNYYNSHMDEYRVPEEARVRHILIKTPTAGADGKTDPQAVAAARAKAEDALKKVKSGSDFAELAKKVSEDTGSASQGGELGWIQRGRTVPEFEKVAFSQPVGQISDLIQSTYGFHIIQVEEKHTPHVKSLEEVKAEIEPVVALQKSAALAENLANAVQSEGRKSSLGQAAAKNGLEIAASPVVARTETLPGIGAAPDFMTAVFSAHDKNPPEMVRIPQGYAVFQVTAIQPPATPTFEAAKGQVEEAFKRERVGQLMIQKSQELSDRARAEHNLKKMAQQLGATLKTSELVGPDAQVPDVGSLASAPASAVFDMKPGDIGIPIRTARGEVVISLLEKQEPPATDLAQKQESIRESLLEQKRRDAVMLFIDGVRERMEKEGKIRIYKQEMDRLIPKPEAS